MERDVSGDALVNSIAEAESAESSGGQDQTVVIARVEFLKTGNDVPTNVFELKMRIVVAQLG
jgi:ABC-type cobalamin/Fe3+-siderophores transport system ATPase subunit